MKINVRRLFLLVLFLALIGDQTNCAFASDSTSLPTLTSLKAAIQGVGIDSKAILSGAVESISNSPKILQLEFTSSTPPPSNACGRTISFDVPISPSDLKVDKDQSGKDHFKAAISTTKSILGLCELKYVLTSLTLQTNNGLKRDIRTSLTYGQTSLSKYSYPNYFQFSDVWAKTNPNIECPEITDLNLSKAWGDGNKYFELCNSPIDLSQISFSVPIGSMTINSTSTNGYNETCKTAVLAKILADSQLSTTKYEKIKQDFVAVMNDFKNKYPGETNFYENIYNRWSAIDSKANLLANVLSNYCNLDTTFKPDQISTVVQSLQVEVANGAADVASNIPYLQGVVSDKIKQLGPVKPAIQATMSINCIKGRKSFTVKGVSPKCPTGYRKK